YCLTVGTSICEWCKCELLRLIQNSVCDGSILQIPVWSGYKRQIVSDVVDHLASDQEKFLGHLRRLIRDVCDFNNFRHLEQLQDGAQKAARAKEAVAALKALVEEHDMTAKDREESIRLRKEAAERLNRSKAVLLKLEAVKKL